MNTTFAHYFRAVNNPDDPFYTPDEDVLYFNKRYENNEFSIMFEELNVPFTYEEISKACSQLHTIKSADPDKLINEFYSYGKDILGTTLLSLFNKLFSMGYIPKEWSRDS